MQSKWLKVVAVLVGITALALAWTWPDSCVPPTPRTTGYVSAFPVCSGAPMALRIAIVGIGAIIAVVVWGFATQSSDRRTPANVG